MIVWLEVGRGGAVPLDTLLRRVRDLSPDGLARVSVDGE